MVETIGVFFTSPIFTFGMSLVILLAPFQLKRAHSTSAIQTMAVSVGILGTFLGIFGGLVLFDTQNIEASIPVLLGGLKTAFLTSITGSVVALALKIWPSVYGIRDVEEVDPEQEELTRIRSQLELIHKALVGEEEVSLVTQVQKLRTSLGDKQDELNKSFREFAQKMLDDNRASLVQALEAVIRDFNAQINEQFGENFKHLNEGVGKMLEWQANYTRQVETAVVALDAAKASLGSSDEVLKSAATNAQEFKFVADQLKVQLEAMGASMTGMKNLAESLKDSGKEIQNSMEEITRQSIESLGSKLAAISEKMVDDYSHVQRLFAEIRKGN